MGFRPLNWFGVLESAIVFVFVVCGMEGGVVWDYGYRVLHENGVVGGMCQR